MLIFGEKINTINRQVAEALEKKDKNFFISLAMAQVNSGIIDILDINVGSDISVEPDNMKWAVDVIEAAIGDKVALSIDSSYPKTLISGIEKVRNKKGLFLNSITLDESRYKDIIPIAKEYDLNIIALPIYKNGIPDSADKRLDLALKIAELAKDSNISLDKLYIDCIIEPVSISTKNALVSLDTISKIKKNIPEVNTFICLSAVSLGLPNRKLINRNFLPMLVERDIDAIILDPLDTELILNLYSAKLLLGRDKNCLKYLKHIRNKSNL